MGAEGGQPTRAVFDEELCADAWDVYFPAPLSLSLVANAFAHNGMQRELGQLLDLHDGQVDKIVADLQGLVAQPPRACLDIIPIAHHSVPGQQEMHLHVHAYTARTALEPSTGKRISITREELAAAAQAAWHRYTATLRAQTTKTLGFGWDPLPDDPSADVTGDRGDEVRVAGLSRVVRASEPEFCVCHGYLGPHEQIMAEAHPPTSRMTSPVR